MYLPVISNRIRLYHEPLYMVPEHFHRYQCTLLDLHHLSIVVGGFSHNRETSLLIAQYVNLLHFGVHIYKGVPVNSFGCH